ncbi:MAG: helix-turn-helix domain-containing protein [Patescibacteria group bacterium]
MKNNLLAWLLSTGLDEQRAALYLAALGKGEATAGELAIQLGMSRTAIYDNLRVLEERGYIKTINQGKRKLFVPLHPKELYKKIDSQKEQLKDLLPDFLALYANVSSQPFVQIFSGQYAAREVFEDILKVVKAEYVYFSPPDETIQTIDKDFIKQWIDRRVKKGIKSRSLRVKSKSLVDDPLFSTEEPYLRQIRYLPGYVDLKSAVYIYENSIGVISTKKEGAAFIIHSPDLAFSMRQLFDFLWGISLKS